VLNSQLWVAVVEDGCFFGLLALAYFLNLTGAGFFNFAIGAVGMASALGASWLVDSHGWSMWPAVIVAAIGAMALAAVTELAVVRPVQARSGGGELPALVAVSAALFAIVQLANLLFGSDSRRGQPFLTTGQFHLGSAVVDPITVPLVAVTVVAFVAAASWLRFTSQGRLVRAIGDSTAAARVLGYPVGRTRLVAFVLAGLVAAVACLVFAGKGGVSSTNALQWTLDGFLALVIGGTGSIWAPLLGGLVLAIGQIFIPFYFGGAAFSYALVIVALVFFAFRPQGIFTATVRV
jgi:branched-chain amino acid transport system permease protein